MAPLVRAEHGWIKASSVPSAGKIRPASLARLMHQCRRGL